MKTPHKHAELIKAWADGAEIEIFLTIDKSWIHLTNPNWDDGCEYRIKPEPMPDVVKYALAGVSALGLTQLETDNLKLTFDGETGKLKAAEVIE